MSTCLDSLLDPERRAAVQAWDSALHRISGVSAEEKAALLVIQPRPTVHEQIASKIAALMAEVEALQTEFDAGVYETLEFLGDAGIAWKNTYPADPEANAAADAEHFQSMCDADRRL